MRLEDVGRSIGDRAEYTDDAVYIPGYADDERTEQQQAVHWLSEYSVGVDRKSVLAPVCIWELEQYLSTRPIILLSIKVSILGALVAKKGRRKPCTKCLGDGDAAHQGRMAMSHTSATAMAMCTTATLE